LADTLVVELAPLCESTTFNVPTEDIKVPLQYLFGDPVELHMPVLTDSVSYEFHEGGIEPCGARTIELVPTNKRSANQLARWLTAP